MADSLWGDEVCAACAARGALEYPLAWDKSAEPWPLRFWRATSSILFDARQAFPHLPPGTALRALGYAVAVEVLVGLAELIVLLLTLATRRAVIPGTLTLLFSDPVLVPLRGLASATIIGLAFHGIATLLGGKAPVGTAMRGAFYLRAFDLVWIPMQVAAFLPFAGGVLTLMMTAAQVAFQGWALSMLARGRYGLSAGASLAAGAAPIAIAVAAYLLVQLGRVALAYLPLAQ